MFRMILCFSFFVSTVSFADVGGPCGKWTQNEGSTCLFAGDDAHSWARQCEIPCGYRRMNQCSKEYVCVNVDPNEMGEICTEWNKKDGVNCQNKDGDWEQKWVRACTDGGYREHLCSDQDPN